MELNTGSVVSIMSFDLFYQKNFNRNPLHKTVKTGLFLNTYTGECTTPKGVLKSKGNVLIGRDW